MADVTYEAVEMNEMDRGERVEMMVDIYESVDAVRCHDLGTNMETQQPLQHTGSVSVKSRKQRVVEVCLCLLCALLLTAVIVLCVYFTFERKHLLTHITNLNEERDQILNHNNNLTEEREQLKNKTIELQCGLNEQDLLSDNFKWIYYNFSIYCISTEMKSWNDSRLDCQQRGADLVIIKSQEEYEFLQKAASFGYFWTGLKKTEERVWKWIDGKDKIWYSILYSDWKGYDCALMTSSALTAKQCMNSYNWICKRTIVKPPIT